MRIWATLLLPFLLFLSCNRTAKKDDGNILPRIDTIRKKADGPINTIANNAIAKTVRSATADTTLLKVLQPDSSPMKIFTGNADPYALLAYSKTLVGTPYLFASTDPKKGFDCSGFITYVFNHFNIKVPRSSVDFTNVGKPIPVDYAKPGDLILFTGTDSMKKIVGHMGIILGKDSNGLSFIHSSSGKSHGVTITPLNQYYKTRFMKVIRVFPQKDAVITKR